MITKRDNAVSYGTLELDQVRLESGAVLENVSVAYERAGAPDAPVILVCHALTGSQAAVGTETDPGWWSGLIGRNKAISTEKYQTVTFNVLAGCNGTTGPLSVNPRTGLQYRTAFPFVTVRDIVTVHYLALKKMGVRHLLATIGGSLGGMQTLEFALMYPDFIDTCICLAATPASSDFSIAFNQTARKAIMDDPNWRVGSYTEDHPPVQGLSTARMLGMLTYRSAALFGERFGRQPKEGWGTSHWETAFQVESYLNYQGEKLTKRFDANSYLYLLKALDSHDITRNRGTLTDTLAKLKVPVLAVGFEGDLLYPAEEIRRMIDLHKGYQPLSRFYQRMTKYGHDGFLVECDEWGQWVAVWLAETADKKGEKRL